MGISLHLAMTAAEIAVCDSLPERLAYMACHFSPYSTGLSNIPDRLPFGSMLILNDRTPICGHDPKLISYQLCEAVETLQCDSMLLDFQRPDSQEVQSLCKILTAELPCPVAVSHIYAKDLDCPVFLPPCPPDTPPAEHLQPWADRVIWLDAARDAVRVVVTQSGSSLSYQPIPDKSGLPHWDESLFCHYRTDISVDSVAFTIARTGEDLFSLLQHAEKFGVNKAIGLWQDLHT